MEKTKRKKNYVKTEHIAVGCGAKAGMGGGGLVYGGCLNWSQQYALRKAENINKRIKCRYINHIYNYNTQQLFIEAYWDFIYSVVFLN